MENTYLTIDFGVNYGNNEKYENLIEIMDKSYELGVDKVVCISNDICESKNNIELSKKINQLYFTLGVHPHYSKNFNLEDLTFIKENVKNPKCFGIGEIGLDFNRNYSPAGKQIYAFREQINLAKKTNSKIYLHCRDAYEDFIGIIKEFQYYNGVVHCFTGTLEQAIELTSLGFKLGITGWLLDNRRNKDLINVVKSDKINLDILLVETDAPFMPIKPKKKSTPDDTRFIVQEIAKLKNMDEIKCGKLLYKNAIDFLNS